jgi:Xaa-Pro aminopeptidase
MLMKPAVTRAKAYLKARHKTVRDALKALKLDGLLLTHASDLAYLTNFTGHDSIGLITRDDIYLVTDFRYEEQAKQEAGWVKLAVGKDLIAPALAKTVAESGARRLGFEANFTTVGQVSALTKALKELNGQGQVELTPIEDVMTNIRKVKDDHEIDLVRKAIAVAEEAFEVVREQIKVGLSENYLAGLLISELRSRGAQTASFEPIVAAGPNSALPHYRAGEALVQRNAPLLFDWGAVYQGYCSDLTRTIIIGQITPQIKRAYELVLEAQLAAIKFLRPGVTTKQADQVARDIIDKAGFKDAFGHGLGHGIGRDIHELPTLRQTGAEDELRPGMIVTVEPGIYLPGVGGVRIEDDVLITHSGCEVLSSLSKDLESCHIE